MSGVVRVSILKLWNECRESVERVQIGAGVKIGGREGRGCVGKKKVADALASILPCQKFFHVRRNVEHLLFPHGVERYGRHCAVIVPCVTSMPRSGTLAAIEIRSQ